jgi:hypothetical protein
MCLHACAKCARFLYEVSLRARYCVHVCVLCFLRICACIHSVGAMPLGVYMCARKETRRWQEELLIWLCREEPG